MASNPGILPRLKKVDPPSPALLVTLPQDSRQSGRQGVSPLYYAKGFD